MKRIILLTGLIAMSFTACKKSPYPFADFTANTSNPALDEFVNFTNLSTNADEFEWNFGDGTMSNVPNPSHAYNSAGDYTVTLTAIIGSKRDVSTMTIKVYCNLTVEVAEWNIENTITFIVPNARVRVYPTLTDWDKETNLTVEGYTDKDGIVSFDGLLDKEYYIEVSNDLYNNFDLRKDDPKFVITSVLGGDDNYFLAWADYFGPLLQVKDRTANREQRGVRTAREYDKTLNVRKQTAVPRQAR